MGLFRKFRRKLKQNAKEKWFDECLNDFKAKDSNPRFSIKENDFLKCLDDNTSHTGFDAHYEYHQGWAARILAHLTLLHQRLFRLNFTTTDLQKFNLII